MSITRREFTRLALTSSVALTSSLIVLSPLDALAKAVSGPGAGAGKVRGVKGAKYKTEVKFLDADLLVKSNRHMKAKEGGHGHNVIKPSYFPINEGWNVQFGGGVPVSGSVNLHVGTNGQWKYTGNYFDGGVFPYNESSVLFILDGEGTLYTFAHNSYTAGDLGSGTPGCNWTKTGTNKQLKKNVIDTYFHGCRMGGHLGANIDLGSLISDIETALKDIGAVVTAVASVCG